MKLSSFFFAFILFCAGNNVKAQTKQLFMDVHQLKPGSVTADDVAVAHAKDLGVQAKYGVECLNYWVDEKGGTVYCLALAPDSAALVATHKDAHGLLPQRVYAVTAGQAAAAKPGLPFFFDAHQLGTGNVTAAAVAAAHQKDLAVQGKHGVNCLNYWVAEKEGVVFCLAQANAAADMVATHKEAHGLLPVRTAQVKPGQ